MPLILTLDSRQGGARRESRTFNDGTLSIGRGAANDWVLADPDRLLSKTHCMISLEGSRYVLTDTSTNGVFINGAREPTARDSRAFLTDGDVFRLGDYTITVTEADTAPAPRAAPAASGFGSFNQGRDSDPFGDAGEDPFGAEPGTVFHHPVSKPTPAAAFRTEDPFASAAAARPGSLDIDDDLFQGITPSDNWAGPSQRDNADAPKLAFAPPKPVAPVNFNDLDIDDLLGDEPIGAPTASQQPPPRPVPRAPEPPPVAAAPSPIVAPPVIGEPPGTPAASVPAATTADAAVMLAALLRGAGVPDLRLADPVASMEAAGAVFRAMVEGLREVLMSRAAIKGELRVEQTMLRARDNNALKFSVTVEEAVAALLLPPRTGYKAPIAAVQEAARDIQSHEMAVMAGVQTALIGLLKRFDPAALEARLSPGRLDSFLPGARKARIWELFCDTYKDIAREAEDDFQSVFGREFARAYDAQMKKL
jgi:type VI secretion system FHA domain protein